MMLNEVQLGLIKELPTHRTLHSRDRLEPMDECYMEVLTKKDWKKLKSSEGKKDLDIVCGAVGKAGNLILERYLDYYLPDTTYSSITFESNKKTFIINELIINTKTRLLIPINKDKKFSYYDRSIHIDRFPVMIPEAELSEGTDIFICTGYNVDIREGYILGWIIKDELEKYQVNTSLRYPALCIPLGDLHPIRYINNIF